MKSGTKKPKIQMLLSDVSGIKETNQLKSSKHYIKN